jgi:hypothetical protein
MRCFCRPISDKYGSDSLVIYCQSSASHGALDLIRRLCYKLACKKITNYLVTIGGAKMPMITFEATEEEKRVIEKLAKKEGSSISEYVRGCVYMDLLLSGDMTAFRVFSKRLGEKARERLRQPRFRKLFG